MYLRQFFTWGGLIMSLYGTAIAAPSDWWPGLDRWFAVAILAAGLTLVACACLRLDEEEAIFVTKLLAFGMTVIAVGSLVSLPNFAMLAPAVLAISVSMIGLAVAVHEQEELAVHLVPNSKQT